MDTPGHVAHWADGRRETTLGILLIRMVAETHQHAGHADIIRELIDGRIGGNEALDQGVQLTRPVVFKGPVEGWWYVDLVEVELTDAGLVVHDLYVDFLVPPGADRYHVLDLDELADALSRGQITAAQCATVLSATQRFIDRHLRAPDTGSVDPPYRFPPESITALETLPRFLE